MPGNGLSCGPPLESGTLAPGKWRAVYSSPAQTKYVMTDADERDPGAYIDRLALEDDPFSIIEGLTLAG
jgi:NADH:ubiquinone oxidoreductase subunit F (NADH-binding)